MSFKWAALAAGIVLAAAASAGQAAVVASSLPYLGNSDWATVAYGGSNLTSDGTTSTLSAADGVGVYFGWDNDRGNGPTGWALGYNATGNYLDLTASFSAGAEDWDVYSYDRTYYAGISFARTTPYGYGNPVEAGIRLAFSDGMGGVAEQHLAVDLTQAHRYEYLLQGSTVSYRIDGHVYAGAAYATDPGFRLLVIGDGSGSTQTGRGVMTIHSVSFDNAPAFSSLEDLTSAAPEPAAWTMMIGGFGFAGAMLRRRRVAQA